MRITRILPHLEKSGLFETLETRPFPDIHIHWVHDADFIDYLARAFEGAAGLPDFYSSGDDKIIYSKPLKGSHDVNKKLGIRR